MSNSVKQNKRPVSSIGPTESIRSGQLVKPAYDTEFGEFVLAVFPANGGEPTLAPCWTELYRENPVTAKSLLLQSGAQLCTNRLQLVLSG